MGLTAYLFGLSSREGINLFSASSIMTQVDHGGLLSEPEIGLTMAKPGVQRLLCSSNEKCRCEGPRAWALEIGGN